MEDRRVVSDPADPRRCQATTSYGQCTAVAEEGHDRCRAHGGRDSGQSKRMYLLQRAEYRNRLAQLSEHDDIKSLREEISLIRMLIEERLNLTKNDADRIAAFGPIQQAAQTVEKLTKTLHQMETSLGNLLHKSTLLKLGQSISQAIVEELQGIDNYEAIVDRLNARIVDVISAAENDE